MAEKDLYGQMIPLLRRVGLFSRCTDYELKVIARKSELRKVSEGETVISRGEESSELYIVLEGSADVVDDGEVVHSFGVGEYFGELAALSPAPRTSDVVATSPSLFAVVERDQVFSLVDTIPGVARKMLEGLAGSLRESLHTT
jgi:CRP-like cAMP-binding protein